MSGQRQFIVGPQREGEEPSPLMHGHEKSDPVIVARKPTNKAGRPELDPIRGTTGRWI